ncbi:MAG: hypothetical protein NTX64_04420 [Elusimicrobia bacterium]|nr:hypothetical protein [Elusimicrobiota bacterium]
MIAQVVITFFFVAASAARAVEIYAVYENGGKAAIGGDQQGFNNFVNRYQKSPQTMTVYVDRHPLQFKVLNGSGQNVTQIQFVSRELRINQTFTGANSADVISKWKDYAQRNNLNDRLVSLVLFGGD